VLVKWSFSRRLGGYVSHTRLGGCTHGKSKHICATRREEGHIFGQISILWVVVAIIPISMVLGAALGAGAMLVIFFEAATQRAQYPAKRQMVR
jgi:hypothetical protein